MKLVPALDHHPKHLCFFNIAVSRFVDTCNAPLVRTPKVVDFPLSTFPTTAHRTSGVKATLGGGNRSSNAARGGSAVVWYNVDV